MHPVYLLYGEAEVLAAEAEKRLRRACFPDEAAEAAGYGRWEEAQLSEALAFLSTIPFGEGKRMARVELEGPGPEGEGNEVLKLLADYLPEAPSWAVLVLRSRARRPSARLSALCQQYGEVWGSEPEKGRWPEWLAERARLKGLKLAAKAAWLLSQLCDHDPALAETELDKLAVAVEPGRWVTEDEVRRYVFPGRETPFALAEAWARGDLAGALRRLARLREQEADAARWVGALAWQVRSLLTYRYLEAEGVRNLQELARSLETTPAGVKAVASLARAHGEAALEEALQDLAEADFRLKTGQVSPELALEEFLTRHTPSRGGRR